MSIPASRLLAAVAAAGVTATVAGVLVLPLRAEAAPAPGSYAERAAAWPDRPRYTWSPRPAPSTTATPTPTPTVRPTSTATPTPTATTTPTPAPSATTTTSPSGYTVRADWAAAVLRTLNAERAAHGLPALTSNVRLVAAAHTHNQAMASANTLSHQLSGEPALGARVTAAGYTWSSVGENVAWNSRRTEAGVLALQESMYNEVPPNDGHRRNILSTSFTEVGIDVIDDSVHGRVWLVTDFGRPR